MKRPGSVVALLMLWVSLAHGQNAANLNACKYGYVGCDSSRLTTEEREQVAVAAHARNFTACKYGYAGCDSSHLTSEEREQVAVAAHVRNFTACKYGYVGCDSSHLTSEEREQVAVAAHVRNFTACKYGYASCDRSLLSLVESAENTANSTIAAPGAGSADARSSGVAENGSYYGQPNANGVPKTVHVNGYYRKDGTHVRGHYRSAPGTNPRRR